MVPRGDRPRSSGCARPAERRDHVRGSNRARACARVRTQNRFASPERPWSSRLDRLPDESSSFATFAYLPGALQQRPLGDARALFLASSTHTSNSHILHAQPAEHSPPPTHHSRNQNRHLASSLRIPPWPPTEYVPHSPHHHPAAELPRCIDRPPQPRSRAVAREER
jgi:hypothetical protein